MAQAAFFVNALRIIDKGKVLVLEAQRQCSHGHIIDQIYLSFPAELKSALQELEKPTAENAETPEDGGQPAWKNRLREYLNGEN